MSINIQFTGAPDGNDGPFQVSSAVGWQLFSEWVNNDPELKNFVDNGRYKNTHVLGDRLGRLLNLSPSMNENVRSTSEHLLTLIGPGDEEETIEVVD